MSPRISALCLAAFTLAPAAAMAQARGPAPITDAQPARVDAALKLDSRDFASHARGESNKGEQELQKQPGRNGRSRAK